MTLTTLVTFNGANGSKPDSSLIADSDGNLFGMTSPASAGRCQSWAELASGRPT